jgi:hypothetical protein
MTLDALLRAHGFMKVERPPVLWTVDTEDVRFVPLLGEMIAAALGGGAPLHELTLNASNVVVEQADDAEAAPPAGEYVAVSVSGRLDLGPDDRWRPTRPAGSKLLRRLHERLLEAGVRFAYIRRTPPIGSITVFLVRTRESS